jgi:CubicO group peptidase (beta-lactamase class C family)
MKSWLFAAVAAICSSAPCAFSATANAPNPTDLMVGSPPAATNQVTIENWMLVPYNAWAFHHLDTLLGTTTVDRGTGPVAEFQVEPVDLDGFQFTDYAGKTRTVPQFLEDLHVDSFVLYADGKLRQEVYRNGMTARDRHLMMSVTKSFTGLIAEMLIADGKLDDKKLVSEYVPELKVQGGAYADATLRDVMNMEVGIDFAEIYDDPSSTIFQFAYAAGFRPPPPGVKAFPSLYEFLPSMMKKGEHGKDFHYVTANSEVLGWVIEKVTGRGFADVFQDMVYSKIGAERDAFYANDPHGKAIAGGGLNITARDALRLAVMMAQGGRFNGQQIVPTAVVNKIAAGSTPRPSLWGNENGGRDHSYMSQWYIDHKHEVVGASGIHGQTIHFQPKTGVVMVLQSSYPEADGAFFVTIDDFFNALAERLAPQERSPDRDGTTRRSDFQSRYQ